MHLLKYTLATLALSAPALAGPDCDILDIPQCIGWQVTCPSHAPTFSLTFTNSGLEINHLTGPNFNTPTTVVTTYSSTSATVAGQPVSTFTSGVGLEGRIERLAQPSCSDGHILDGQQFELTVTNSPTGVNVPTNTTQPSFRACCVIQPH